MSEYNYNLRGSINALKRKDQLRESWIRNVSRVLNMSVSDAVDAYIKINPYKESIFNKDHSK